MGNTETTSTEIIAAYAAARLQNLNTGPLTAKAHAGGDFSKRQIAAAAEVWSGFGPSRIMEKLIDRRGRQIMFSSVVEQYAKLAFDDEQPGAVQLHALDALKEVLTALASIHPVCGEQVKAARKDAIEAVEAKRRKPGRPRKVGRLREEVKTSPYLEHLQRAGIVKGA